MTTVTIHSPGPLATIQDRGRRGMASLGVGQAGAADMGSFDLANRLVGNLSTAACIETTLGGLTFAADGQVLIVVTGASVPIEIGGQQEGMNAQIRVEPGVAVKLGTPSDGVRSFVAVRGGFNSSVVLGSRSYDTLAQLGPPPLTAGTKIDVGNEVGQLPSIAQAPVDNVRGGPCIATYSLGPRDDWFSPEAIRLFESTEWIVAESNRIGLRLAGPLLERCITDELPSEGTPLGGVQVTPDGPIVLLRDRPLTGGYPVIGVVSRISLDSIGQLRPGDTLTFSRFRHS